jgi:hypothetical protein
VTRPAVHFVGFKGEEYLSAVRVWGEPDFIHRANDRRMRREVLETDTIVYARGSEGRPSDYNVSDLVTQDPENGV